MKSKKQPIQIRFKRLANGNQSLYLDSYKDGKRKYEFLRLYLIPATTEQEKAQNKHTLQLAETILAKRIIALNEDGTGIHTARTNSKTMLLEYIDVVSKRKTENGLRYGYQISSLKYMVETYLNGKDIPMRLVDIRWVEKFVNFMLNDYSTKRVDKLKKQTAKNYYVLLKIVFKMALEEKIITSTPFPAKKPNVLKDYRNDVEYLTIDEVKTLEATPSKDDMAKNMFLFSCYCGLRYSDVIGLKWSNIVQENGKTYARIKIKKTGEWEKFKLNDKAMSYLPQMTNDVVFNQDFLLVTLNRHLKQWSKSAGITKNVHFHVARHTFATMLLTKGIDLYTVSKLLGHKDIATTQIYAKVIDEKKEQAVDVLND